MKTKLIIWAMSVAFMFLPACMSSEPSPTDNILNVKVIATETKTPLSIHFFTLKSIEVFRKLDYFELASSKRIDWNDELISRAKTLLIPGSTEIFQVQLTPDIQYYALVIGFKDVDDNDNWRYTRTINANGNNNIALKLSQVNEYTSKAVRRVSQHTNESSAVDTKITKIANSVEYKVDSHANRAIDNRIDRTLGRIFQ